MHLFVVNTQNFWRSVQIWAGGLLVLRILFDPMNFFLIPEIHTNFCRRVARGPAYFFFDAIYFFFDP